MKKVIILALLVLAAPVAAQAWVCFAQAPNGAGGTGSSFFLGQAQANALYFCQMDGGGPYCEVLSCQ